jgi:hypothetical protein
MTTGTDPLDAFAAESPPQVAGHCTHASPARDIPFIFHQAPMPLFAVQPARGRTWRVVTVIALLAAVGSGAYVSQSNRTFDLDILAAWASRFASQRHTARTAMTPPATPPTKATPTDRPPTDPPVASKDTDTPLEPDRNAITVPARPQITGPAASLAPVRNVAGAWRLDAQTETSDSSLERVNLHYEITLTQDGDRVAGVGTIFRDEHEGSSVGTQTPVTVTGTIVGDRLTLNFVERGTNTRGKFVLVTDQADALRGRFSSSATQSSGHVEARRMPVP